MTTEVELTFIPTISGDNGELRMIALPYITPRIEEIIADVVYPHQLISVQLRGTEIVAVVLVTDVDINNFLDETSYFLTDREIMRMGIAPPQDLGSIGQDIWAQGDISLDEETLGVLRMTNEVGEVEFIPILISYNIQ